MEGLHHGGYRPFEEYVAVEAPGLAQLPLGTVAVHGMFEMTLGDGEQHLRGVAGGLVDGAQRIGG